MDVDNDRRSSATRHDADLAPALSRLLDDVRSGRIVVQSGPDQRLLQRLQRALAAHGTGWRVLRGEAPLVTLDPGGTSASAAGVEGSL